MSQRTERIDQLLREEIGAILAREIADPRIGFATITDVETTPDLRHAKVWVSVIGSEPERAETVAILQRAMGFVQRELGHRLRLKRIPALHVRLDDTADRSTRVMKLLAELDAGTVAEDLPTGETLPTPVPRIRHGDELEEDPLEGDGSRDADQPATPPGRPRARRSSTASTASTPRRRRPSTRRPRRGTSA